MRHFQQIPSEFHEPKFRSRDRMDMLIILRITKTSTLQRYNFLFTTTNILKFFRIFQDTCPRSVSENQGVKKEADAFHDSMSGFSLPDERADKMADKRCFYGEIKTISIMNQWIERADKKEDDLLYMLTAV